MTSNKKLSDKKVQEIRTEEWDMHDSTELIVERGDNWLNDERFQDLDYSDDDEMQFCRGDDYCERNIEKQNEDKDEDIEDFVE